MENMATFLIASYADSAFRQKRLHMTSVQPLI